MFGIDLLRFLNSYWYIALIVLFFLLPLLSRIQDAISGKDKRKSEERLLAQKEDELSKREQNLKKQLSDLSAKAAELDRQQKCINSQYVQLLERRQNLNDLVRSKTVEMARSVASREYLQSTPAFSALSYSGDILPDDANYNRLRSVLNTSMQIVSPFDISADIRSSSGNTYHTTLYSCSCPDFQFRKVPCKHMLRLAIETGLLLNFRTDPLEEDIASLLSKREELLKESYEIRQHLISLNKQKKDFDNLLQETKQSYPWLAAHYADFLSTYDNEVYQQLLSKARNVGKVKELKQALRRELRYWRTSAKEAQYQLIFYESLFPWLLTFKEVPPIEAFEYATSASTSPQEEQELLRKYLSPEESSKHSKLSSAERYQLALDRYISQKKSPWAVGIEYERYIGYLCESSGYSVNYTGATDKLEDMGRDLILEKGSQTILVQCKRWAKEKTIHENHVFQLAGSTYEYQLQHQDRQVIGAFVATIGFSPVASHCAEQLGLRLFPNVPFQEYPRIKCNIRKNENGEIQKIYHLPMDQQYDKVRINSPGEFYAWTVKEAEDAGFRRAYRWHGSKQE